MREQTLTYRDSQICSKLLIGDETYASSGLREEHGFDELHRDLVNRNYKKRASACSGRSFWLRH
jgi:hypothetical protein